ncbi:hypothetical protein MM300_18925 [Evansella sp. LMS18]|uniref:hypothetical protein n=1 Tax=Evansella sp. LMS18 TaxID=2924033 RepID=UPI0020D08195|nr:hypothetical protein [Evansella sp. LMS18]UTR09934.1 hypothetical protein MM300_18925 [Evansella sp. LMS18]
MLAGCGNEAAEEVIIEDLNRPDGLGKLENDYESGEFRSSLFEYERYFSQNSYEGDIDSDSQEEYKEGDGKVNVLVSASHSTAYVREGEVLPADVYTGAIAHLLHEYANVHIIFSAKQGEDGNYVYGGSYKETIGKIIGKHEIDLVIDLHGAARDRYFDVDIGTNNGITVRDEWLALLKAALADNGINSVYENHTFAATHEGTVANYTYEHLNSEAIQLEINREFRDPTEDMDAFYQLVKSLLLFVENVEVDED